MEFSWTVFGIGLALGVVQLVVGIVLGRALWPRRRGAGPRPAAPEPAGEAEPEPLDVQQLRSFTARLHRMVTSVANDVGHHQVRIEQMTKDLSSLRNQQRAGTTDFVLGRVAEIVEVNRQLQVRLAKAEDKLQAQTEQIKFHVSQAQTDPLTGLPNRRAFDRELQQRLDRWNRRTIGFCLVMIDTDDFKPLNDCQGHLAGDALLRAIAETVEGELTPQDVVARIGGDEFALILADDDLVKAAARCERIRRVLARTKVDLGAAETRASVSVGVARIAQGENETELMSRADQAMYAAKAAGKGRVYLHDGTECVPLNAPAAGFGTTSNRPVRQPTPQPPPADDVDEAEIAGICDDVRLRLDEVLGGDLDPSTSLRSP